MAGNFRVRVDKRKLQTLIRQSPGKANALLDAAAAEGVTIVRQSFNTSPPGRRYRRTKGGKFHVASQAGYPPNRDMGKLYNAIYWFPVGRNKRRISTGDTEYAPSLEFGTRKMAARPFMGPMAKELEGRWPDMWDRFAT